jgi:hypothetical protein
MSTDSIDEYNKIYFESNSEEDQNYIELKEEYKEDNFLKEELSPNKNSDKDNPDASNKPTVHFDILGKKKKRGRQTQKSKKPQHLSTDSDNLEKKIQVHFFTFIINLSNDAIKAVLGSKTPYNFKQIAHKLKIKISNENVKNLHKSAIKDILKMENSVRKKDIPNSINNDTLNAVCHLSKLLEDFFEINYLEFFNDFYFNEEKETNKIFFGEKEIPFSKRTKNFCHLLKKYKDYKTLLIDSAKSFYFNGYNELIRNNSFVTSKTDIELNK